MYIDFEELHEHVRNHAAIYVNAHITDNFELAIHIRVGFKASSVQVIDVLDDFEGTAEDFKKSAKCQEMKDYLLYQLAGQVLEIFDGVKGLIK